MTVPVFLLTLCLILKLPSVTEAQWPQQPPPWLPTPSRLPPCFTDQDCCNIQIGTICSTYGACLPQPKFLGDTCSRSLHCQLFVSINSDCVNQVCVCRPGFFDQLGQAGGGGGQVNAFSNTCVPVDISYISDPYLDSSVSLGILYIRILTAVLRFFRA